MLKLLAACTGRTGAFLALVAIAGCGGGDADGHASASGGGPPTHASRPPTTAYQPSSSGGGGGVSEGFGSSASSARGRIGGTAGALRAEEMRRIAAIERAHRPPGPERLTGADEEQQRQADWVEASHVRPISSADDDSCQRSWDQHVATTEAFHTRRHDGLHAPISASERAAFLSSCRAQSEGAQLCGDPDYMTQHIEECQRLREEEAAAMRRRTHPRAPTEPQGDRDPLDSFDE